MVEFTKAQTALHKARIKILLEFPFFSFLLSYLKDEEYPADMPSMRTLGTDGEKLYYDAAFVETLPLNQLCAILLHEVLHPALGHIWRIGFRNLVLWNMACDYKINAVVKKSAESHNDIVLPSGCLLDKKYDGMCEEEIYELLKKTMKELLIGGGGGGKKKKDDGHPWDSFCQGVSTKKGKKNSLDPEKQKELAGKWKDVLARAAIAAKGAGKLPADFESLIDEVIQPKIPWKQLLSRYVQSAVWDDYRILPPHKNHIHRDIYLPSEHGEFLEIVAAVDTSGSIDDEQLKEFISEMIGICKIISSFKIHYFACDAAMQEEKEITSLDDIPKKFKGRGGTDFRPVFDRIKAKNLMPSILVYFTDGDPNGGIWPDRPPYPVIWLISGNRGLKVPYGEKIDYEGKNGD